MAKPRILLITSPHLFGESMETFLRAESDIELVGPWNLDDQDLCRRLPEVSPAVVVIADEDLQSDAMIELTRSIIEQYPELSVIRIALNENVFRIFSTHTLPARGADLLETIHGCILRTHDAEKSDLPEQREWPPTSTGGLPAPDPSSLQSGGFENHEKT